MQRVIKGFDGVRALAVLSVVLTHLGFFQLISESNTAFDSIVPLLHGGTGVQVFFVLSGFLITLLLVAEFRSTGKVSLKGFVLRRTLRIFPLYVLFLVVVTVIHLLDSDTVGWRSLAYGYAYAYNFIPTQYYETLMGHTWSLAVEEHFYIVWPAVFMLVFKRSRLVLAAMLLVFIIFAPLLQVFLIRQGLADDYFVDRWSFVAGASIAVGCLAGILASSSSMSPLTKRIAGGGAGLVLGVLLYSNSVFIVSDSWAMNHVFPVFLRNFGIAVLVLWLYFNQEGIVVRALEMPPLKYIGLISYGIYMYQGLFLGTGPTRDPARIWPPSPEVGLGLLILVAPLSFHYFERPFLRLKSRYSLHAPEQLLPVPAGADKSS